MKIPSDLDIATAIDTLTDAGYEYHGATTTSGSTVFSFRPPFHRNAEVETMHLTVYAMLQEATIYLPTTPHAAAGNRSFDSTSGK
jgi:hypothetical protein